MSSPALPNPLAVHVHGISRDTHQGRWAQSNAPPESVASLPWKGYGTGASCPACISLLWKGSEHPCLQLRTQGPSSASPSLTACSTESRFPGLLPAALYAWSWLLALLSPLSPESRDRCEAGLRHQPCSTEKVTQKHIMTPDTQCRGRSYELYVEWGWGRDMSSCRSWLALERDDARSRNCEGQEV